MPSGYRFRLPSEPTSVRSPCTRERPAGRVAGGAFPCWATARSTSWCAWDQAAGRNDRNDAKRDDASSRGGAGGSRPRRTRPPGGDRPGDRPGRPGRRHRRAGLGRVPGPAPLPRLHGREPRGQAAARHARGRPRSSHAGPVSSLRGVLAEADRLSDPRNEAARGRHADPLGGVRRNEPAVGTR